MVDRTPSLSSNFSKTHYSPCFNHYSIIENFLTYDGYALQKTIKSDKINHSRNQLDRLKPFFKRYNNLEDYYLKDRIIGAFENWLNKYRDHPLVMHAHNPDDPHKEKTWIAKNRFQTDRNTNDLSRALENYKGRGVFLTLTVDPKKLTLFDAWKFIAKYWHKFIVRLKIESGQSNLNYIWVLEAQANGYPHIHALFLGIEYLFRAGSKSEWEKDNAHSKNLKHFWGLGSIFINKTAKGKGVNNPVNYLMKYIRKTFSVNGDNDKKIWTQSLLWTFNKRSFNLSRGFYKFLNYTKPKRSGYKLHSMNVFVKLVGQRCKNKNILTVLFKKPKQQPYNPFYSSNMPLSYRKIRSWILKKSSLENEYAPIQN
jgi:hypothetical protein